MQDAIIGKVRKVKAYQFGGEESCNRETTEPSCYALLFWIIPERKLFVNRYYMFTGILIVVAHTISTKYISKSRVDLVLCNILLRN